MARYVAIFLASCIVLLFSVVAALLGHGIQARSPGKWEARIVTFAKHKLLVGGKQLRNPSQSSVDNTAEGQKTFSHYCYACHGLDGQNTGVPFAESMSPPVPSLASKEVQSYSDGQLFWIINNGLWPSGMPASRGILTDDEIWSTVAFIRHLPPAGSLGEPRAYSGE
jgi:mono/diheme cytochrome c family protein